MRKPVGSVVVLLSLLGCGVAQSDEARGVAPAVAKPVTAEVVYRVSGNGRQEILFLGVSGGDYPFAPWYRLFGDGRLVREIVRSGVAVVHSEEMELPPADVEQILRSVVNSRLAELTQQRVLSVAGGRQPGVEDGEEVALRVEFDSYQRRGEAVRAPFVTDVHLSSPALLADRFPDFTEAKAAVDLRTRLEGYFPEPFNQALLRSQGSRQ